MKQYWLWMLARLFLGGIFIFSGFLKLSEPVENFRGMIAAYGVIPYAGIGFIAYTIPWLEFVTGIFLVLGYFPRAAALVLGFLAFSFVSLIVWAKLNGTLPENCGCFGEGIHISPYQMVLLDLLNILLAVRLFQIKTHRWAVSA